MVSYAKQNDYVVLTGDDDFLNSLTSVFIFIFTVLGNWSSILKLRFPGRVHGRGSVPNHHVVVGMRDQVVIVVTGNSRRKERHDRW